MPGLARLALNVLTRDLRKSLGISCEAKFGLKTCEKYIHISVAKERQSELRTLVFYSIGRSLDQHGDKKNKKQNESS